MINISVTLYIKTKNKTPEHLCNIYDKIMNWSKSKSASVKYDQIQNPIKKWNVIWSQVLYVKG